MAPTIEGLVELPQIGPLDVRVRLEDVTMQDAASVTIAETNLSSVQLRAKFSLEVSDSAIRPSRTYALTARARRPGESIPTAGTVAIHSWTPADPAPHTLQLRAFHSSRGDAQ